MALKSKLKKEELKTDLYIGIDVHLKSWHVTICSKHIVLKSFSQPPTVEALMTHLENNYSNDYNFHSVYEAGFCGFWIHRDLVKLGVNNIVVNASDVPTTDKEKRQKRDKIDSLKLAKTLRSGILQGIYIPSIEEQGDRSLLRVRKQLVKDISRFKVRIKSHLRYKGIKIPQEYIGASGYWNKAFRKWLIDKQLLTNTGTQALVQQLESLQHLENQLNQINNSIKTLATTSRFKERMELVTSVPGIGILSGMVILTELGNIERFKRIDCLNSFAGFIPNVYSSGDKERVGSLTKRGNNYLRKVIIECSWWAVRKDPALTRYYETLCKRMKPSKAIIRIARKILSRIRYVLMNNTPYSLNLVA